MRGAYACGVGSLAILVIVVTAGAVRAQDVPLAGRTLVVKNRPDPEDVTKRKITWAAGDDPIPLGLPGTVGDPRCFEEGGGGAGGTLRFFSDGSGGSTQDTGTMTLPCTNWSLLGKASAPKGYQYVDKSGAFGPCNLVVVKQSGAVKATCSGKSSPLAYDLLAGIDEGVVAAQLTIGSGTRLCTSFDGAGTRNGSDGKLFKGAAAPAAAACTATPAVCGDGVAEGVEECDDGNGAAGDGCAATCVFETLCLITNNNGSPATSTTVRVGTDGSLSNFFTKPFSGSSTGTSRQTAVRCGRRVYLTLAGSPSSTIEGLEVGLDGTVTSLPTTFGLPRLFGLECNESANLLFALTAGPAFIGDSGFVRSYAIAPNGSLVFADEVQTAGGGTFFDSFSTMHPITKDLYVAEAYDPPLGGANFQTLSRVTYDAAGNLSVAQSQQLSASFGAQWSRDLAFTADAGYLAVVGHWNGSARCFAHWVSPGTTLPAPGNLVQHCAGPLPVDGQALVARPEGGPLFYYQSPTTLHSAAFDGTDVVSAAAITPVHSTNQLLLAFGGRLLISVAPAGQVATYDVGPDLVTLTPNDTVSLGAGPDSGVLVPCPDL